MSRRHLLNNTADPRLREVLPVRHASHVLPSSTLGVLLIHSGHKMNTACYLVDIDNREPLLAIQDAQTSGSGLLIRMVPSSLISPSSGNVGYF